MAPEWLKQANKLIVTIQELITENMAREKAKEVEDSAGVDPLEGKAINRYKHLLSRAHPDDTKTYERMDEFLRREGHTHSSIMEGLNLQPPPGKPVKPESDPSNDPPSRVSHRPWEELHTPGWLGKEEETPPEAVLDMIEQTLRSLKCNKTELNNLKHRMQSRVQK